MRPAAIALVLLFGALPLRAADVALGIRHLAHAPAGDARFEGGDVEIVSSRGFGATAEMFFTPYVSAHAAATFVNPAAFLHPAGGETVDLNTLSMDTYAATARVHLDRGRRLVPFAGAGAAYTSFGNLEERFDDRIELSFDDAFSWIVEAGARYHVTHGLWIDATLSYMPLEAEPAFVRNDTPLALPAKVTIDPAVFSVGAGWRW
jgi:outer membrane protein W